MKNKSLKKNNLLKLNQNGSTITLVLAVSAVISIGLGFLANRVINQGKMTQSMSAELGYDLILKSVSDYSKYALKRNWCLETNDLFFLPMEATVCSKDYTINTSTKRLIWPLKMAKTAVRLMGARKELYSELTLPFTLPTTEAQKMAWNEDNNLTSKAQQLLLDQIVIEGDITQLPDQHPLKYLVTQNNTKGKIKKIKVTYRVDHNLSLPRTGDEVYVDIITELLDSSNNVIVNGFKKAIEHQKILVAPRENNFFSLILRGSLVIGNTDPLFEKDKGNLNLEIYQTTETTKNKNAGVNFNSPVYIDKNLIVPNILQASDTKKNERKINNIISFNDDIIIGSGKIKTLQSGILSDYKYNKPLGDLHNWTELGIFKNIESGFEIESKSDEGFESLAGNLITNEKDLLTKMCIDIIRSKFTNTVSGLRLAAQKMTSPINSRSYRLSYDSENPTSLYKFFQPKLINTAVFDKIKSDFVAASPEISDTVLKNISYEQPTDLDINKNKVALVAEIKWEDLTLTRIPIFDPIISNNLITGPSISKIILKNKNASNEILKTEIIIENTIPVLSTELQLNIYRDLKIKINAPDNDLPKIQYIKITALDNTCQKPMTDTQIDFCEPLKNNPLVDYRIIYLKNFTSADELDEQNCSEEKYYNTLVLNSPYCLKNSSHDPIINLSGLQNTEGQALQKKFNSCSELSSLNTGELFNKMEQTLKNGTAGGWNTLPLDTTKTGDEAYQNLVINEFHSSYEKKSTLNNCTIKATVSTVTASLLCMNLIIEKRSTPLTMIGTFIVVKNFKIDNSAIEYGLNFYNIHHPKAIEILRTNGRLKAFGGASCNTLPKPYWHPNPGMLTESSRITCSPLHLIQGNRIKNTFRWSSVTSNCFIAEGDTDSTCVDKTRNYFFKTLERSYGQQF